MAFVKSTLPPTTAPLDYRQPQEHFELTLEDLTKVTTGLLWGCAISGWIAALVLAAMSIPAKGSADWWMAGAAASGAVTAQAFAVGLSLLAELVKQGRQARAAKVEN